MNYAVRETAKKLKRERIDVVKVESKIKLWKCVLYFGLLSNIILLLGFIAMINH